MRPSPIVVLLLLTACAHGPDGAPTAPPPPEGAAASAGAGEAEGPWLHPAETLSRIAHARPAPAGAPVEIVLESVDFRFAADGTVERTVRRVFRVLTQKGAEEWGQLVVGWRERDGRPQVHARVLTPEGAVHVLPQDALLDRAADDGEDRVLDDLRRLEAPLPAVAPGAVVEEVVVRRHAPRFPEGFVWRQTFSRTAPVRRLELALEWSDARPLRWTLLGGAAEPTLEKTAEGRRARWVLEDVPAYRRPETLLAWERHDWPEVRFTTGKSWAEVAAAYAGAVDAALAGVDLAASAREAVGGAEDLETRLDRLLAWMATRVRYTSLSLGDGAWFPASPAEVLRRGWGDCKDQSTLLVGLLRALGHPADVVLLPTDADPVVPELPGMGGFDHAIVRVEGEPATWVDPTVPQLAPGVLPRVDLGRAALVARDGVEGLTRTPEPDPADHRYRELHVYEIAPTGEVTVEELTEAWGDAALRLGGDFRGADPERFRTWAEGYFADNYAGELVAAEHGDGADGRYWMRIEGKDSRAAWSTLDEAGVRDSFSGVLTVLHGLDAELSEERTQPVVLPEPRRLELRVRLNASPGFRVSEAFQPLDERVGPVVVTRRVVESEPGWVEVETVLDTGDGRLTPDEYTRLRETVLPRLRETFLVPLVHEARAALDAGRAVEAVTLARAEVDARPGDATARRRLAMLLLDVGLQEPARDEARKAVELAPEDPWAWHTLGEVLQYDAVGRRRGPGYDRAAALDALREAVRLKPGDETFQAELAIALEHLDGGAPNLDVEELAAAVEAWEAVAGLVDQERYRGNYLRDLLLIGRMDRLLEVTEGGEADLDRDMHLAALAARDGAEAAAAWAEANLGSPEVRVERLRAAAANLFLGRRYGAAAELFGLLGRQTRDFEVQSLARQLRLTRRVSERIAEVTGPTAPLVRLYEWMTHPQDPLPEGILSGRSRTTEEGLRRESEELLQTMLRQMGSMPLAVALDVGVGLLEPRVEGDDRTGYLVRPQSDDPWFTIVVPEAGGHRLLVDGADRLALGRALLERVDAGEAEVARTWLRWTVEHAGIPDRSGPVCASAGLRTVLRRLAEGGPEELRLAASLLMLLTDERAEEAWGIAWDARPEDEAVDRWRRVALGRGALPLGRADEVVGDLEGLSRGCPTSALLAGAWLDAARAAGRAEVLDAEVPRLLASPSGELRQAALDVLMRAGRIDEALAELEDRAAGRDRSALVLNNLAWFRLLAGDPSDGAVEAAEQAVMLRGDGGKGPALHTLAAAHAALDHVTEARAALLQSMEEGSAGRVDASTWVVIGRMAATYGLRDYARAALRRAADDEQRGTGSGALARRWLEDLEN